ncbi:MAG: SLC13 family permease [Acidobacteriota bacterium]
MGLTPEMAMVLGVLVVGLVLFVTEWLRVDVVALSMVVALVVLGIIEPKTAFSGFGSPPLVFLAGLFVMSGGLVKTGLVERLALLLRAWLRGHPERLAPACIATVAGVSAFVSNTVTVSLFVPVVSTLSKRGKVRPGSVLMPMAFASMLGGTCTVIGTSTNVVVSGQLEEMGLTPYAMFTTALVGLPALLLGMIYLLVIAPRLLRERGEGGGADDYSIRAYLAEVIVTEKSRFVGRSLKGLRLADEGVECLGVVRRPSVELAMPEPDEPFRVGDRLLVKGSSEDIFSLAQRSGLETVAGGRETDAEMDLSLVEAMVAPGSALAGHTLKEALFRQRFGAAAIAIYRHGEVLSEKVGRVRMRVGDVLLVQGSRRATTALAEDDDLLVLDDVSHHRARSGSARRALVVFAGFLIGGMVSGQLAVAALAGGVLMIIAGCLTAEEAQESVDWRLLVLIGGMISMAHAMSETGAAEWVATNLVAAVGDLGPRVVLATFFLMTVALTQAMSNQAAALVVLLVGLEAGKSLGIPPLSMAVTITMAASCAFLTPLEPVNVLVYGPGRYRFLDFARVGAPLTLLVLLVTVLMVPWVFPFG